MRLYLVPRNVRALARLFPVLDRVQAVAEAPASGAEVTDQHELRRRAYDALDDLLTTIADQRPLVLCIDDLQWGDLDSAALLSDLIRRLEPPKMLLVLSFRSEEQERSPVLRSLLAEDPLPVSTREVEVGALPPAAATELTCSLLGGNGQSSLAGRVVDESEGSPLFINTLAGYLRAPDRTADRQRLSLEQVLYEQIHALPDEARRLLEVIAVAGQPLATSTAEGAAGVGTGQMERLLPQRLIRRCGDERVEPYHDRIRETVVGHLTVEELRERHGRLAAALEASGADDEQLAFHLQGCGANEKAASHAARAAAAAAEKLAFERAARLYGMALALGQHEPDEARRLNEGHARALAGAGRGQEAAEAYTAAAEGAVFWVTQIWPLAWFNVLSVGLFYPGSLLLLRRGRFQGTLLVAMSELVIH